LNLDLAEGIQKWSLLEAIEQNQSIHQTLRITPAMAAGVADRAWETAEIAALLEALRTEVERAA
jgi:hypothetical protein